MPSQLEHTRSPQPPARLYPESCAAYYKSGDTSGGQKMIDPMQNGSPLSVNCQYGGGKVITEVVNILEFTLVVKFWTAM